MYARAMPEIRRAAANASEVTPRSISASSALAFLPPFLGVMPAARLIARSSIYLPCDVPREVSRGYSLQRAVACGVHILEQLVKRHHVLSEHGDVPAIHGKPKGIKACGGGVPWDP